MSTNSGSPDGEYSWSVDGSRLPEAPVGGGLGGVEPGELRGHGGKVGLFHRCSVLGPLENKMLTGHKLNWLLYKRS